VNCDPIARWYRGFEYVGFGGELERRSAAFLPDVAGARRILVLGEGDGRFLVKLVEQNQGASIDCVDLSSRMLALARTRAGDSVTYHHADARTIPLPTAEYDLIVTHFFLDCFNQRDAGLLITRLADATKPNALWLVSEFRQPHRGWRAMWARAWLGTLYLFFRITTGLTTSTLVDHHPLLERAGFRQIRHQSARFALLASELWVRQAPGLPISPRVTSCDTSSKTPGS
jgi:ubiquinone/menaquinone biosynthesis C-methylase UbiE